MISESGLLATVDGFLMTDEGVDLQLTVPGQDKFLNIRARTHVRDGNRYAFHFLELK